MIYLLRKLNLLAVTLILVSVITFSLSYILPGSQLTNISGVTDLVGNEYQQLAAVYKTDANLAEQYLAYLTQLFAGNWGISFTDQTDVFEQIVKLYPATLELIFFALFSSLFIGLPLGIIAALRYHKKTDRIINVVNLIGHSIPVFWLALLMILVFSISLEWFPTSGRISLLYDIPVTTGFLFWDIAVSDSEYKQAALYSAFRHLVLPTLSITAITSANIIKFTRASMLEVMDTQYIKSARARGLSEKHLIYTHAIRNALLPIIPQMGFQISLLFTAAMITENIFSWPGIGSWLIEAIYQRDFPAITGGVLAVSSVIIFLNMAIDLIYVLVNPQQLRGNNGQN